MGKREAEREHDKRHNKWLSAVLERLASIPADKGLELPPQKADD